MTTATAMPTARPTLDCYRTASGSVYEVLDGCVRKAGGDPSGRVHGWTPYRSIARVPACVKGPGRTGEILEIVLESGRALYTTRVISETHEADPQTGPLKSYRRSADDHRTGRHQRHQAEPGTAPEEHPMTVATLTREVYRTRSGSTYEVYGSVFRRKGRRSLSDSDDWMPYASIERVPAAVRGGGASGEVLRITLENGRVIWTSPLVD